MSERPTSGAFNERERERESPICEGNIVDPTRGQGMTGGEQEGGEGVGNN